MGAFVNNRTGKPARADQELIVFPGEGFGDPDGIGVIVYGDGHMSNRWGDGTAGLNDEVRAAADDETDALDPETRDLYVWNGKAKAPRRYTVNTVSGKVSRTRKSKPSSGLGVMRMSR